MPQTEEATLLNTFKTSEYMSEATSGESTSLELQSIYVFQSTMPQSNPSTTTVSTQTAVFPTYSTSTIRVTETKTDVASQTSTLDLIKTTTKTPTTEYLVSVDQITTQMPITASQASSLFTSSTKSSTFANTKTPLNIIDKGGNLFSTLEIVLIVVGSVLSAIVLGAVLYLFFKKSSSKSEPVYPMQTLIKPK